MLLMVAFTERMLSRLEASSENVHVWTEHSDNRVWTTQNLDTFEIINCNVLLDQILILICSVQPKRDLNSKLTKFIFNSYIS